MTPETFTAKVRRQDDQAVLDLTGEINAQAEAAINAAFAEAEGLDPARIVLNFAGVEYINSTGIALLVGLLARARMGRRPLSALGLSDHYREIFNITRLSDFIQIQ